MVVILSNVFQRYHSSKHYQSNGCHL